LSALPSAFVGGHRCTPTTHRVLFGGLQCVANINSAHEYIAGDIGPTVRWAPSVKNERRRFNPMLLHSVETSGGDETIYMPSQKLNYLYLDLHSQRVLRESPANAGLVFDWRKGHRGWLVGQRTLHTLCSLLSLMYPRTMSPPPFSLQLQVVFN